ncbi:MAG: thioredoxin domain-containing protein, partial [Hyphomicrobiales bacterium]|nr:thioredoxin domain-containing protein [Hyphomicrobiales bacterium]
MLTLIRQHSLFIRLKSTAVCLAAACLAVGSVTQISTTAVSQDAGRLEASASPYLRLHATDPVDWREWGESVFEEARISGRPIFLSIGYLACHWCHVMQRESFTDSDTANVLNSRFIPVLVDREARPDLDALYQELAARLGIQTGWPLNLTLTPEGRPFFGGVYFPPEPRAGIRAFRDVLTSVADLYEEDPAGVDDYAQAVVLHLSMEALGTAAISVPSRMDLGSAITRLAAEVDDLSGGFGDSAKFMRFPAIQALLRGYLRSGDEMLADAVKVSTDAIVAGAIRDHIGGGFFRYTVDPLWRQPHFEKMLDINAMAIAVLTEAWRANHDVKLERAVSDTVAFLISEFLLPSGAFATALDADSDGREGAFYLWDRPRLRQSLGMDDALFHEMFALAEQPEGIVGVIPYRTDVPIEAAAEKFGSTPAQAQDQIDQLLARLKAQRAKRIRPARDDKIVADWNALAVSAMVQAAMAFDRPDWLAAARTAFRATLAALTVDDTLHHSAYLGRPDGPATLEDRAFLARAALDLYMAEGMDSNLATALDLIAPVSDYADTANGGYFMTALIADQTLPRLRSSRDSAAPSGNAVLAEVLAALYFLTGNENYRTMAENAVIAFGKQALERPLDQSGILIAADILNDAIQIVIVAKPDDQNLAALRQVAWQDAVPGRVFRVIAPDTPLPDGHPAQYKERVND